MKKKFLALALAAAMVVPATNAFAETNKVVSPDGRTQTIGGSEETIHEADVKVEGSVLKGDGTAPAGKIEVELPTATNFVVRADGTVKGSNFDIKNTGGTNVKVILSQFIEEDINGGITINKDLQVGDIGNHPRSTVKLSIEAREGVTSESFNLDRTISDQDLITIPAGRTASVHLTGIAGTKKNDEGEKVEQNGVRENFTLRFKIQKSQ